MTALAFDSAVYGARLSLGCTCRDGDCFAHNDGICLELDGWGRCESCHEAVPTELMVERQCLICGTACLGCGKPGTLDENGEPYCAACALEAA